MVNEANSNIPRNRSKEPMEKIGLHAYAGDNAFTLHRNAVNAGRTGMPTVEHCCKQHMHQHAGSLRTSNESTGKGPDKKNWNPR